MTPLATVREVSGDDSVASSLLALLIGGLGVSLGILLVTGAVAAALAARQRGASLGGLGAYRALRPHGPAIGGIVLRTVPALRGPRQPRRHDPGRRLARRPLGGRRPRVRARGPRARATRCAGAARSCGERAALAFTVTVYGIGLATGPIVGLLLLFLASSWSLATINAIGSLVNLAS
ncbi:MAG: hypothetical protein R3C15_01040 [Thermoleophilia bacterium]